MRTGLNLELLPADDACLSLPEDDDQDPGLPAKLCGQVSQAGQFQGWQEELHASSTLDQEDQVFQLLCGAVYLQEPGAGTYLKTWISWNEQTNINCIEIPKLAIAFHTPNVTSYTLAAALLATGSLSCTILSSKLILSMMTSSLASWSLWQHHDLLSWRLLLGWLPGGDLDQGGGQVLGEDQPYLQRTQQLGHMCRSFYCYMKAYRVRLLMHELDSVDTRVYKD